MMAQSTLAIGDVTSLKSGGPRMTVIDAKGNTVKCQWHTTEGQLQTASFPPEALTGGT